MEPPEHYAEQMTAQGPSTINHTGNSSSKNREALVLSSPTSLAAFDASIRDMNVRGLNVPRDTIIRSSDAANWLLDQWTIEKNTQVQQNQSVDSVRHLNRPTHSRSDDDVSSLLDSDDLKSSFYQKNSEKKTRTVDTRDPADDQQHSSKESSTKPNSPNHSNGIDMSDYSESDDLEEIRTRNPSRRTDGTRGGDTAKLATISGTCLEVIPLRPNKYSYSSTPVRSFQRSNPQIQWRIDCKNFLQILESNEPKFVWIVYLEGRRMNFVGRYFMFGRNQNKAKSNYTVLSANMFSKEALNNAEGIRSFRTNRYLSYFDLSQSPLKNLSVSDSECYDVPRILKYVRVVSHYYA